MTEISNFVVGYANRLADLRQLIQYSQQRAALSVNREHLLYYQIVRPSLERQQSQGWGAHVTEHCLKTAVFPDMHEGIVVLQPTVSTHVSRGII